MGRILNPAREFGGTLRVPGDKSIAHRAVLLSLLSEGDITIKNFPDNADCNSSLSAVQQLGVKVQRTSDTIVLTPPEKFEPAPDLVVDCGNSGTTARLLAGILAGIDAEVTLSGDESLRSRPMKRIIDPLTEMGAEIFSDNGCLPMKIRGRKLLPFEYTLPVASAQVKSAIIFAGLASSCSVVVREETITRDHTELILGHLAEGVQTRRIKPVVTVDPLDPRKKKMTMPETFKTETKTSPQSKVIGGVVDIPGDMSTAAFFFAAAAISGESITIEQLGLNPTRDEFLTYLKLAGCKVKVSDKQVVSGELRGTVTVTGGKLVHRKISGEATVGLIDEIPILSIMAAFAKGTTVVRDAAELKVKETDRIAAISHNLEIMGVKHGVLEDGLAIEGGREFNGADFKSFGDHRIAMAFSIASLFLVGPSTLDDDDVVGISCPKFYELVSKVAN